MLSREHPSFLFTVLSITRRVCSWHNTRQKGITDNVALFCSAVAEKTKNISSGDLSPGRNKISDQSTNELDRGNTKRPWNSSVFIMNQKSKLSLLCRAITI